MSWSSMHCTAPSVAQVVLLALVCQVLTQTVPEADAKRFDCRLFCKETGFHAMLGGCRCSFTLFTAKRAASREPFEEGGFSRMYSHLLPRLAGDRQHRQQPSQQYYSTAEKLAEQQSDSKSSPDKPELDLAFPYMDELRRPSNPFAGGRLGVVDAKLNDDSVPSNKRREFEMDLDNGNPVDFLRMSY